MRRLALGIVILLTLVMAGCLKTLPVAKQLSRPQAPALASAPKEHNQGVLAFDEVMDRKQEQSRGMGLIRVEPFEIYANNILTKLKNASGVSGLPGQVFLKAEKAWSAKTSASGNIYIPIGMLGDIHSEDVFAALLAHELAHVINNHTDSDLLVRANKKGVYVAAMASRFSNTAAPDSDTYLIALGSLAASEVFLSPLWSREQETEADKMGLDILVKAGYSPNGMEMLLEIVEVLDERNRRELERRKKAIAAAHANERNEALRQLDFGTVVKSSATELFKSAGSVIKGFKATHKEGNVRLNDLRDYKKIHYRRLPRRPLRIESWQQALNIPEIRQAVTGLEYTFMAQQLLLDNNLLSAEKNLQEAYSETVKDQAFYRNIFAELRAAQGQHEKFIQNHKLALKGYYPSLKSYHQVYSKEITGQQSIGEANRQYSQLVKIFDDYGRPPEYYQPMIQLAEMKNLQQHVLTLQAQCLASYAGDGVVCSAKGEAEAQNTSINSILGLF